MAQDWQTRATARPAQWADIDVGLRQYMLRVYNYMGAGLALTGVVAYIAAASGFYQAIYRTPLFWLLVIAPLGLVLLLGFRIQSMSLGSAQASFWAYAGLMGVSLGGIFLVYTGVSIATTFFITAAMFLGMSLYGYTTGRDLTQFGSFLFMGLIGIVVAGLVNIFLASPGLQFAISVIGVVVFTGLTAWDTQRIKEMYFAGDDDVIAGKKAIMGALALYLDFLNLFMMLLQFMGQRRN
ncbi:MAG TPA: Bax inhibitor-1/YccA family protein [Stellaceae bacterium]|nr:Bax inhibitor-1/YccA family protein [Stellaceae bacterium]